MWLPLAPQGSSLGPRTGGQPGGADQAALVAEARRLVNAGQAGDALAKLEALPPPRLPAIGELLGVAYFHVGDHARAIAELTAVVDQLPDESIERREAVQVLGLCYYLTGRFGDAIPRLEATRGWAAGNLELSHLLALSYIQTRQPDRARDAVARTFAVASDSPTAHLLAAQLMIRLEFDALAEAELREALRKQPSIPRANLLLGQIALFRGRTDEAIELSRRELSVNPTDAMAFAQVGDGYVRQSKWDEAIAALQQSVWLNPYYSAPYILLGKAYMKKGQPETAEGMLRRAVQYDPNNRSAHYLLAQLLQQSGRTEEAKTEFEIAEKLQGPAGR